MMARGRHASPLATAGVSARALSLLQRTSCDGPPATSADLSVRDGAVTSPVAARSLL
jgi:hypothetical protein